MRTQEQVQLLRTLNRVNGGLKKVPLVPTLNNRLFRRFNIAPRALCQNRLANYGGTPFTLPEATESFLRTEYADDWAYVNERCQQRVD